LLEWKADSPRSGASRHGERGLKVGVFLAGRVLKALTSAGAKGLTVKQLAVRAKVKRSSLAVWLYTSGKKIAGFKKIAPGAFAYTP
jgi:hypothetical protein